MENKTNTTAAIAKTLAEIAKKHFDIETLETRNSDSQDFHDISIWQIRDALWAAFQAGQASVKREGK